MALICFRTLLLIKVEKILVVFIYCTEQLNLKNISYWHYFTTKIMSICPIWNFTLYVAQSLHFFENHPYVTENSLYCLYTVITFDSRIHISSKVDNLESHRLSQLLVSGAEHNGIDSCLFKSRTIKLESTASRLSKKRKSKD